MTLRIIAHLDMDAFFAAVEERDHPRLKGKPIIVGADPENGRGRGVVATANYEARKFGIHSAMSISEAWRRAKEAEKRGGPETVFMAGNFQAYEKVSAQVMEIIGRHAPVVEQASVDEAYFDLSHTGSFEAAEVVAREVKREIRSAERLTASVGIGPNKLLAKIASDREKPDGLTVVLPEEAKDFLAPLPVRVLPGIGPKAEADLASRRIRTISDLRELREAELHSMFGAWGGEMYEKARGRDDRPLQAFSEAKSIGEQETFSKDTLSPEELTAAARSLAADVGRRFLESGFRSFRIIVLTVRFADFRTVSRRRTLSGPSADPQSLEFEALKLLMPFLDGRENPSRRSIRLLGVRVERLSSGKAEGIMEP